MAMSKFAISPFLGGICGLAGRGCIANRFTLFYIEDLKS